MKKYFILLFISVLLEGGIYAQECGSNSLHQQLLLDDNDYLEQTLIFESLLGEQSKSRRLRAEDVIYKVPVVIHLMHVGEMIGEGANLTNEQVRKRLRTLNQQFRKQHASNTDERGVDVQIEFALAVRDEDGNCTNGIVRYDMSGQLAYVNHGVDLREDYGLSTGTLKTMSRWNPNEYYNIYVVNKIDNENCDENNGSIIGGFANYAAAHGTSYDATVLQSCVFQDTSNTTLTHELGHAFNLYHTFEGDDGGTVCPIGNGDYCDDTPAHIRFTANPNYETSDCDVALANDCQPGTTTQDHIYNYMDYSFERCKNDFTADQRIRILTAMEEIRSSYLASNGNMSLAPPATANVDFMADETVVIEGSIVLFTDMSSCTPNSFINTPLEGISFQWTFDNGVNIPIVYTDQNPAVTFLNQGTYDVTLEITNSFGVRQVTKKDYIFVGDIVSVNTYTKPLTASFEASDTVICAGESITFTDASTNNPIAWIWAFPGGVTGDTVGQSTTVEYSSPGKYQVTLHASNNIGDATANRIDYITVVDEVSSPSSIKGPTYVCDYSTGIQYYIDKANEVTSYEWEVPSGATITSGQGTPSINVSFGEVSGGVAVKSSNACTNEESISSYVNVTCDLIVTVFPNPATDYVIVDFGVRRKITRLILSDLTGRVIFQAEEFNKPYFYYQFMDEFPGIYILYLESEGNVSVTKIVKM